MLLVRKLTKDEKGMTAAFVAVLMLVLVALAGLVLDGGILMLKKLELSSASDASALAVSKAYDQSLWENEGKVVIDPILAEQHVITTLQKNMPTANIVEIVIDPVEQNKATIKTKAVVETVFMKAFGIEKRTIYITVKCVVG
jgi:Flp pilus assembly protein TadG